MRNHRYIPVSGKVYDHEEIDNAIAAAKDGWWTEGRFAKEFESKFRKMIPIDYVTLVNSGSSANLVALASLTSKVFGERRLKPGDEIITTPLGFPTTVNPALMYGLVPVFIDAEKSSLNLDVRLLEKAYSPKTRAIMIAHTLGKPFHLDKIMRFAKKHNLWVIEDCCDALGSTYKGAHVGTFGHIATFSFYPAHQITMGEGGAVITKNPLIHRSIRQFRDWGRDCWCDTGKDNTCGRRFGWQLGELPMGYDHKYIYSQIGFNLKLTDFQAAIGVAQLKKLPMFVKKRRENHARHAAFFDKYSRYFEYIKKSKNDNPSWFGFTVIIKKTAPFTRNEFTEYLEKNGVGTRNVFSGNILRHPAYKDIVCRKIGTFEVADAVTERACWIGVFPGITSQEIKMMHKKIETFLREKGVRVS
jgi:CDP-6-deoxy-D-xylo-4-hexulose-3-dehydrase